MQRIRIVNNVVSLTSCKLKLTTLTHTIKRIF